MHDVLAVISLQGVLDVLMVQRGTEMEDEGVPPAGNILAYRQSLSEDHMFLKVLGMSQWHTLSLVYLGW